MKELTPSEQEKFIEVAKKRSFNEFIVLLFAMETGLRVSELANVKISDVKDQDSFWVRTLKQRHRLAPEREIPISKTLKPWLEKYILNFEAINNEFKNPESFLFLTQNRNPMSVRYMQWIVKQVLLKINRPRHNFHSLRHTFARNLVRKGIRLEVIQALLGHKSLSSTGIYTIPDRDQIFSAIA